MDVLEIAGPWGYSPQYSIGGVDRGFADATILKVDSSYVSTGQKVEEGPHKGAYIWKRTVTITVKAPIGTYLETLGFSDSKWLEVGFSTEGANQTVTYLSYSDVIDYLAGEVRAYFEVVPPHPPTKDSAIDLRLVGVPPNVGSLTGGGLITGEVGASVTYGVTAELLEETRDRYRFLYWLDDQNFIHLSKSFSKAFTFKEGYSQSNPEVKTFTAYFGEFERTGLILRSASSGIILRGRTNMILRDA